MKKTEIRAFALATLQRVIRSFAAALLALLTTGAGDGTGVTDVDWAHDLSVAGLTAVVTLLFCLAGAATSGSGPAFGKTEITSPPASPDARAMPLTNPH